MSNILQATNNLEDKLENLIEAFLFLKEENELLHTQLSELQNILNQKQEELNDFEESYRLLKIAKTIEGSDNSTKDTKLKINTLIRQIDGCITKLSD